MSGEQEAAQALRCVPSDVERLVRAVSEIGHAETDELRQLIPTNWDDRAVVEWFLASVRDPAPHQVPVVELNAGKLRTAPGWFFPSGSRGQRPFPSRTASAAVLRSGKVLYENSERPHPDDGLALGTLRRMGTYVGLQPLTLPPRPGISLAQKNATLVPYLNVASDQPPVLAAPPRGPWVNVVGGFFLILLPWFVTVNLMYFVIIAPNEAAWSDLGVAALYGGTFLVIWILGSFMTER